MDFKNKYFKLALKTFGMDIVGKIICAVVSVNLTNIFLRFGTAAIILFQLIAFIIYYVPIHSLMWKTANSDINKERFGNVSADKARGFKVAALAMSPYLLFSIIIIILKISGVGFNLLSYRISLVQFLPLFSLVAPKNNNLIEMTFLQTIICSAISMIPVLASHFSYQLGLKNISITEKIIYKKNKSKR